MKRDQYSSKLDFLVGPW